MSDCQRCPIARPRFAARRVERGPLHAASVMVSVPPARLRDSHLAVEYAERLADSSHHQDPNSLLILAEAYLQDGQMEKAAHTAREGLSHLAPQPAGTLAVRCRVLLEHALATILENQNRPSGPKTSKNTGGPVHP